MFNFKKIKKNTIIDLIIIFFLISISIITIINTYSKNTETLSNNLLENNQEYDFDCDGENDQLTIISTNSTTGDKGTNSYILNSNSIKDITFSNQTIPSLGNIQTLINLIEADYELDDAPDIFTAYIPSEELGILWNLDKSTYRYSFQRGYFYDISWDDSGKATSIYWILSFEKVNFTDSNSTPQELTIYVKANLEEVSDYKISSIIKN